MTVCSIVETCYLESVIYDKATSRADSDADEFIHYVKNLYNIYWRFRGELTSVDERYLSV